MSRKDSYIAIGLMSGTSLDGLDMAACRFWQKDGAWQFEILQAETLEYDTSRRKKLANAPSLQKYNLEKLDREFGRFLGSSVKAFIEKYHLQPDLVASHGHTVFHRPDLAYTLQIGSGEEIRKQLSCPVVFDFRSQDVALGGQGAPLVPIGDRMLFPAYEACVNIGGFANISMEKAGKRIAWDICPANIVLNPFAQKLGFPFDNNGNLARKGKLQSALLDELNQLDFYTQKPPKSLGKEWVTEVFDQVLKTCDARPEDFLHTLTLHMAVQIAAALPKGGGKALFTGGGAYNGFLMEQIRYNSNMEIVVPEKQLVEFKEALIFAFMGLLRLRNEVNVLASVTGACRDHSSGTILA